CCTTAPTPDPFPARTRRRSLPPRPPEPRAPRAGGPSPLSPPPPPRAQPRSRSATPPAAKELSVEPVPDPASPTTSQHGALASSAGGTTPLWPPLSTPFPDRHQAAPRPIPGPSCACRSSRISLHRQPVTQGLPQRSPSPMCPALHSPLRYAHQRSHLCHRPVLDTQQLPRYPVAPARRAQCGHRFLQVQSRQHRLGRIPDAAHIRFHNSGQYQLSRSSAAQEQGRLASSDPPHPPAARPIGSVAGRPPPHPKKGLLQHVLHIHGRQHHPQARCQPGCMPGKQLPKRPVVTSGDPGNQPVVIHHLS